jgi:hypothetical protein
MSKCKAQPTADPPQDCNWPWCGCDPAVDKVLAAIQESDMALITSAENLLLETARQLADTLSRFARDRREDDRKEIARLHTQLCHLRRKEKAPPPDEGDGAPDQPPSL